MPNRARLYGVLIAFGAATAAVGVGAAAYLGSAATSGPTVTAAINAPSTAPGPADRTAAIGPPLSDVPGLTEITVSGGVNRPGGGVVIHDPSRPTPITLAALPDDSLIESGRYGPLPVIAPDGRRPKDAYARPDTGEGDARIAIVIGGIGIDPASTGDAISNLPGAVTLAFAPYGDDREAWLASARSAGHEVLLQIPLEPYSYPAVDPGPHTLTTGATADENLDDLQWLLSRLTTYVGVINYMGARFTSETAAMTLLLEEIGSRGLVYIDDGSSPRSRAGDVARGRVPFLKADAVLDADLSAEAIDDRLAALEATARERGYAVATATAFPVIIERVAAFAATAADRGLTLVPVSALAGSVGP